MPDSNLGYLYYKEYYDELIKDDKCYDRILNKCKDEEAEKKIQDHFNEKNGKILKSSNIDEIKQIKSVYSRKVKEDDQEIFFKTTYPGLLIGSGYSHIISEKGEFKLGLEFDYTTGLPIINGSSVKGLLRSVFYNEQDKCELQESKKEYIESTIKKFKKDFRFSESFDFKDLTEEIFEGKIDGENIPMYERDIFYDAVVDVERTEKAIGTNKNIFGEDFITPHRDLLKNPIPLKFLKIMPNVVWCFRFNLKNKTLESDIKRNLFKQIILDFGIGAKTNVGYGYFTIDKDYEKKIKEDEETRKKLKEEEKFYNDTLGKSELQKQLYKIDQIRNEEKKYSEIIKIFNENLDDLEESDKIEFATFFMEYLQKRDKWNYKVNKKGNPDKNSQKVERLCDILALQLPINN